MPCIASERLTLISGTRAIFAVQPTERERLAALLQATVPDNWPPQHYDQQVLDYLIWYLAGHEGTEVWLMWYMLLPAAAQDTPVVIGSIGFTGAPSYDGTLELGYSVLAQYQRKGYASEAIATLLAWAFAHEQVRRVRAYTYPTLAASIRVLEKTGFCYTGPGPEVGVIAYELTRAAFRQASVSPVSPG